MFLYNRALAIASVSLSATPYCPVIAQHLSICKSVLDNDLPDISPCQNMTQGRFMVGAAHELIFMRSRCKKKNMTPLTFSL